MYMKIFDAFLSPIYITSVGIYAFAIFGKEGQLFSKISNSWL